MGFGKCAVQQFSLKLKFDLVSAGSDKDAGQYGASSSDSEDEGPSELQLTGRRPSTNYRPEFAAKTLAQARTRSTLLPYCSPTHTLL